MGDNYSNVNINIDAGELSKPATVLIERISDAIGGYAKPFQMKRIAKAEAEAQMIRAQADIQVEELQRRTLLRFIAEESDKQLNMEDITRQAISMLEVDAKPEKVETDWIKQFFDKCRLVSDAEMQQLWAKILAGEANSPGRFSRRTLAVLSTLDKRDAEIFQTLCSFRWMLGNPAVLVYEIDAPLYMSKGVNFGLLQHLDDVGLISFEPLNGYSIRYFPKHVTFHYFETPVKVEFLQDDDNYFEIGYAMLTVAGRQLATVCNATPSNDILDWIVERWRANHMKVEVGVAQSDG